MTMLQYPTIQVWNFIRKEVQKFMPDSISIVSVVITTNRYGQETKTYNVINTLQGKLYDAKDSEKQLIAALTNEGVDNIETMALDLPYGITLTTENEILTSDNKYWQIISVNDTQNYKAMVQALLYRHLRNQVVQL